MLNRNDIKIYTVIQGTICRSNTKINQLQVSGDTIKSWFSEWYSYVHRQNKATGAASRLDQEWPSLFSFCLSCNRGLSGTKLEYWASWKRLTVFSWESIIVLVESVPQCCCCSLISSELKSLSHVEESRIILKFPLKQFFSWVKSIIIFIIILLFSSRMLSFFNCKEKV